MANVLPMRPRSRRRVHARFIVICCVFLIIVLGVVAYATGLISFSSNTLEENEQVAFSASTSYIYTGNAFLYLKDNKLQYDFLPNPRKSWTIDVVDTGDVRLAASSTICVIYNRNSLQCINPANGIKAFSKEFVGEVLNVQCGNAFIAVLKREPNETLVIYLYTLRGEEITPIKCADKFILDFGFSSASDILWTLSLNTGGVVPISILTTYGATTSALTGISEYSSQVIDKVLFSESNIYVVTTHYVFSLTPQRKEAYPPKLIYGWALNDSSLSGAKPVLMLVPRDSLSSRIINSVQILTLPDETMTFSPPPNTLNVFLSNGRIVCATATNLYIYTLKGELKSDYPFSSPIEEVIKLDDTHLLLRRNTDLSLAIIS